MAHKGWRGPILSSEPSEVVIELVFELGVEAIVDYALDLIHDPLATKQKSNARPHTFRYREALFALSYPDNWDALGVPGYEGLIQVGYALAPER
jgi:hypothetical protein